MVAVRHPLCLPLLVGVVLFLSCDSPTEPDESRIPASLDIVGGNGQEGVVGTELANPLVVRVEDASGNPVAGQLVNFRVTAGGGSVFAGAGNANAQGIVQERWTLGTSTADSQRVEARAVHPTTGVPLVFGTFRATARPGPVARAVIVGNAAHAAAAGAQVTDSLAVRVEDRYANPIRNVAVTWAVQAGGGSVSPSNNTSDSLGLARARWTLGSRVDTTQVVTARADTASPVRFTATASIPGDARIERAGGDGQSGVVGQPLTDSLVARVILANGTPVQGVLLTWRVTAGGGALSIDTTRTDANGRARVRWTLGTGGGTNRARVAGGGLSEVEYTATALAPTGTTLTIVSGNGQGGTVVTFLSQPMVVRAATAGGQPVAGVNVTWAIVEGDGLLGQPTTVVTDADGIAEMGLRLGSRAGTNRITASAPGTNTVTFTHTGTAGRIEQVGAIGLPASAAAGSTVGPFQFRVMDLYGNPIAGYQLTWTMLPAPGQAGGTCGSITSEVTDAQGLARSFWTLCSAAGLQSGYHLVGSIKHQFAIQATPAAASVVIAPESADVTSVDDTVRFTARALDAAGAQIASASITWTTLDPGIATVDPNGLARAIGAGDGRLVATYGSRADTAVLRVRPQASVVVTPGTLGMVVGDTMRLTAARYDGNGQLVPGASFTWQSNNAAVATVDANGLVRGVTAGQAAIRAISDGYEDTVAVTVTTPLQISGNRIATGFFHSCALDDTGAAHCWGDNRFYSPLGIGTTDPAARPTPQAVVGGHHFVALSSGNGATCALKADGEAWCWGQNAEGQLGDGTTTNRAAPVPVAGGIRFTRISVGNTNSCGLSREGIAYCWGYNAHGTVGDGTTSDRYVPTQVAGLRRYSEIAVGLFHACAVAVDGRAFCWGYNPSGQVGDGSTTNRLTPSGVANASTFSRIDAGAEQTCAITVTGSAYCWGSGWMGHLGTGATSDSSVPVPVIGGHTFAEISAGFHTCALTPSAAAWCWGYNNAGQLGHGALGPDSCNNQTSICSTQPMAVTGGISFADIDTSLLGRHTCGISTSGRVYCWGENTTGAVGNGTFANRAVPTEVTMP